METRAYLAGGKTPAPGARYSSADTSPRPAPPQVADLGKAADRQLAAPSATPAEFPVGQAKEAVAMRYGLTGQAASSAGVPAVPPAPATAAMAPEPTSAVALAGPAKQKADESGSAAAAYGALTKVASANRPSSAAVVAKDQYSKAVSAAMQEAKGVAVAQRFIQVAPAARREAAFADKAAPTHPVLASFEVKQTGQQLRIVDGDGSVYTGYLRLTDAGRRAQPVKTEAVATTQTARAPAAVREEKAALGVDLDHLLAQSYSFRVAGTNRSLKKNVVFTGNLLATTNLASNWPVQTGTGAAGSLGGSQHAPAQPPLLPLIDSRISGKVVVGNSKAVEVNAIPVKP